jgi:adenylate cyclase
MDQSKKDELTKLAQQYFNIAASHVSANNDFNDSLYKALTNARINEEAEVPGFEEKPMKFGRFVNREFVVSMTDIRKSTEIINDKNGVVKMFLIFYVYAGVVAKIVDSYQGTSTEFLGDGVLNLFDTENSSLDQAFRNSMQSSWDIMDARQYILNPFFRSNGLPEIDLGIGIDHGMTIVTKFGYRNDTDLKAFGKCVYNASKLSKGFNEILVSDQSKQKWPYGEGGNLRFGTPRIIDEKYAYTANKINL